MDIYTEPSSNSSSNDTMLYSYEFRSEEKDYDREGKMTAIRHDCVYDDDGVVNLLLNLNP